MDEMEQTRFRENRVCFVIKFWHLFQCFSARTKSDPIFHRHGFDHL